MKRNEEREELKGAFIIKTFTVVTASSLLLTVPAMAAITAPDFSSSIADMATIFGGIMIALVAYMGFKFLRRMFH